MPVSAVNEEKLYSNHCGPNDLFESNYHPKLPFPVHTLSPDTPLCLVFSPGPNAHRRVEILLIRKIKFHKIHDLMQFIVLGNVM